MLPSGREKAHCSMAAKILLLYGCKRVRSSLAVKKPSCLEEAKGPVALRQQKTLLPYGSKRPHCSMHQKKLALSGSKKACNSMVAKTLLLLSCKNPAAQW